MQPFVKWFLSFFINTFNDTLRYVPLKSIVHIEWLLTPRGELQDIIILQLNNREARVELSSGMKTCNWLDQVGETLEAALTLNFSPSLT